MPGQEPSADEIRAALNELLGWPALARSPQLADLLRYVVEKTLRGEAASIKAYSIAVDVLGRPPSFDPQADPIVRVQARRLRALLDEFHASGASRADVQIQLPRGRYVPEFVSTHAAPAEAPAPAPAATSDAGAGRQRAAQEEGTLGGVLRTALLGLGFTLIGVALAVAIIRWTTPEMAPAPAAVPERPRISVAGFDNLTGDPVLDDDIARIAPEVEAALARFETIAVGDGGAPSLSGTVQRVEGRFVVRASLAPGDNAGAPWTSMITAPRGLTDTDAFSEVARLLAAQLGNATGPLHAPGLSWLRMQRPLPRAGAPYVCDLLYMAWRERHGAPEAEAATTCLSRQLVDNPADPRALAAIAGIGGWRAQAMGPVGTDLVTAMTEITGAASRAVVLAPQSSFAHEQQAVVLARQGATDAATGAIARARALNPANMDAVAIAGILAWLGGQSEEGAALGEAALTEIAAPPPWYFLTRTLRALQQQRFFDAIDAAQALAASDSEFAAVAALAAAPRAARNDLIDRYRPLVLGRATFQDTGILTRISGWMRVPGVLSTLRAGLILAGLPAHTLDRPFNPDGSERVEGAE